MADLTISQPSGAGAGTLNKGFADAWLGVPIVLTAASSQASYLHSIEYTPNGATTPAIVNATGQVAQFTPTTKGTYRVRSATTANGVPSVAYLVVRVTKDATGANKAPVAPARGESPAEAPEVNGAATLWDANVATLVAGSGSGGGTVVVDPAKSVYAVDSATLVMAYDASSIVCAGGFQSQGAVVNFLTDKSGKKSHSFTLTGSPTVDITAAARPGVQFNGSSQRIDCTLNGVASDAYVTVFLVTKTTTDNAGGRSTILTASDTAADSRSFQVMRLFGSQSAIQGQIANDGDTAWAIPAGNRLDIQLEEFEFHPTYRSISRNNIPNIAASGFPNTVTHAPTGLRLGVNYGLSQYWTGILYELLIYVGNGTPMSNADRLKIRDMICDDFKFAKSYRYPNDKADVTTVPDPKLCLSPVTDMLVGRQQSLFRDNVHWRDGYDSAQTLTASAGLTVTQPLPDRWSLVAADVGSYTATITETGGSAATAITVWPLLTAGSGARKILFLGDSNTNRGGSGWIQMVVDALKAMGPSVTAVGTKGPNTTSGNPFSYKHEGIDGSSWATFDTAGSPLWQGGGTFNLAAYATAAGGTPDIVYIALGTNDVYSSTDIGIEADITAAFVHAENILTAMKAAWPSARRIIDPSSSYSTRPDQTAPNFPSASQQERKNQNRMIQRAYAQFNGREVSDKIWCRPSMYFTDPIAGLIDGLHYNQGPAHHQLAGARTASIVGRW